MLKIEVIPRIGVLEITLKGDLNLETRRLFDKIILNKVLNTKTELIAITMIGLTSLDSSGLGALIKAYNLCKNEGIQIIISGESSTIRSVFRYSRLDALFKFMRKAEFEQLYPVIKL